MNKGVKQFIRELKEKGWLLKRKAGSNHIMLLWPPGGSMTVPCTPSDYRWLYNCKSDAANIEEKYGPYVIPEKEKRKERGLDYQKPIYEESENISLGLVVNNDKIEEKRHRFTRLDTNINKNKSNFMSDLDKDIIIRVLTERFNILEEKIGPNLELFKEYARIQDTLHKLQGILINNEKSEKEKINDYIKSKPLTVLSSKGRIDTTEFYRDV